MLNQFLRLTFFFCGTIFLFSQNNLLNSEGVAKPAAISGGIVFTDANSSALYLDRNGEQFLLTASPGCGNYFSLSLDKKNIGFKQIDKNMKQIPCVLEIASNKIILLHEPAELAGQISFAENGSCAFTIGNELFIRNNNEEKKYDLGTYSNLVPISPDAKFVAYNDDNDQLYLLNITTGKKEKITSGDCGYFSPIWSPDSRKLLYSSLAGTLKVYSLDNAATYTLTNEGYAPAWSNDSRQIIFYQKEIKDNKLLNSDLFLSNFTGTEVKQITATVAQYECDPSFGLNDNQIIYSKIGTGKIISAALSNETHAVTIQKETEVNLKPYELSSGNLLRKIQTVKTLDIPYINQVYDTPDYFNGSAACGPTSAMMIVAYYKILPEWNIACSWPNVHTSSYGRYICDPYRFKQASYSQTANDPNGKPAQGAYGFMWASSSPYNTMVSFYNRHGISAVRTDAPAYQIALDEVNAGRPFTICNGLTTAGHITIAHGVAAQSHTLIFNDPYGNKNSPGYPNYEGKNAAYDWPGYNNGVKNLNTVYWSVAANYVMPEPSDTLVDDLDFANGFYLNNQAPASMIAWKDLNQGYNGHMWYSFTTDAANDSCFVTWTPSLARSGFYEVSAYIAYSEAEAAKYVVNALDGIYSVVINQKAFKNTWVSLGKYKFAKGKNGFVQLGDASASKDEALVFDAMKWSYLDSIETALDDGDFAVPAKFSLEQNYPNPFNPVTTIQYHLPEDAKVKITVEDILGKEEVILVNDTQPRGSYNIKFNCADLSSGIYFYRLQTDKFSATKKMIILK